MTMFSMKPKFNLAEFLAENGPRVASPSKSSTVKKAHDLRGKGATAGTPGTPPEDGVA